ncbi:DoxX family protein [Allorhizocola rhizosphaerae]|uniref:DoxX family protein n=1 Tax=Allorhizocola rhizosphaerae TaxID=1872709 RepID=UPI0013C2D2C3|nr:DoxX family protein [Allorhizocola rhizosphaerae]
MKWFVGSRVDGRAAAVTAVIRIFVGLAFAFFGAVKFVITEFEVTEFVKFGFPDSPVIVYLVGLLEFCAGLMLMLGLGARLAALGLTIVMAGAILTAGLTVGGPFHLGVAPVLLMLNLYLLWAGSGSLAIDGRLAATEGSRPERLAA